MNMVLSVIAGWSVSFVLGTCVFFLSQAWVNMTLGEHRFGGVVGYLSGFMFFMVPGFFGSILLGLFVGSKVYGWLS